MSRKRFVIDGEAVILCVHGISDFDALHSGRRSDESSAPLIFSLKVATICASFRSQRARPALNGWWHADPKASSSIHFEHAEIGPDRFRAACNVGLEGLVQTPARAS
jgi:ATP-dependent DNA ligase